MKSCSRCGSTLSPSGYCHSCLSYDPSVPDYDLPAPEFYQKCEICKEMFKAGEWIQHLKNHECSFCCLYCHPISEHMKRHHSYCYVCNKWYLDEKTYNEHLVKHPICEYCKSRFKSESDLQLHKEKHKCPVCQEYFSNVQSHKERRHPHCDLCNEWLLNEKLYREHLVEHPKCEYCQDIFRSEAKLQLHKEKHKCPVCNGYFKNVQSHKVLEHTKCEYCQDIFRSEAELQLHKEKHKCPLCHEYFSKVRLHKNHYHPHCHFCYEWFFDDKTYNEHLVKHPICEYCKSRFKSESDLQLHKEKHKCPVCQEYFSNVELHKNKEHLHSSGTKSHIMNTDKQSEIYTQCKYCNDRFKRDALEDHIYLLHYCPLCKENFQYLGDHLKMNHVYSQKIMGWCINKDVRLKIETDYFKLLRCKECGKQLNSIQGINAHNRFKHKILSEIKWNSVIECLKNGHLFLINKEL